MPAVLRADAITVVIRSFEFELLLDPTAASPLS
jgi:hypothetical protein